METKIRGNMGKNCKVKRKEKIAMTFNSFWCNRIQSTITTFALYF